MLKPEYYVSENIIARMHVSAGDSDTMPRRNLSGPICDSIVSIRFQILAEVRNVKNY